MKAYAKEMRRDVPTGSDAGDYTKTVAQRREERMPTLAGLDPDKAPFCSMKHG